MSASIISAFHALKNLEEGVPESELLMDATTENGLVVSAEIDWFGGNKQTRKRLGGPVLLGTIKIDHRRLIVDVNSTKRAKLIRRLIEKRLGTNAMYKTTLKEPIDSAVEEAWQRAASASAGTGPSSDTWANERGAGSSEWGETSEWAAGTGTTGAISLDDGAISLDDAPPELRARPEEIARHHGTTWFDLPVPALNNKTPRQAAKTKAGRELLESLLLFYESLQDDPPDNITKPEFPAASRVRNGLRCSGSAQTS